MKKIYIKPLSQAYSVHANSFLAESGPTGGGTDTEKDPHNDAKGTGGMWGWETDEEE